MILEIPVKMNIKIPHLLDGCLWSQLTPQESFVFRTDVTKLWHRHIIYDVPNNPMIQFARTKVIEIGDYIYLLMSTRPATIFKYQITGGLLILVDTLYIGIDSNSVYTDSMIDGEDILVSWYQRNTDLNNHDVLVCFGWSSGEMESVLMNGYHARSNNAVLVRQADSSIWQFQVSDSYGVMRAFKLVDRHIVWSDPFFIPDEPSDIRVEGEHPEPVAVSLSDSILLAYQKQGSIEENYGIISSDPFVKGARVVIIRVYPDGTKEFYALVDDYIERAANFCFGYDTSWWVVGPAIDEVNLNWKALTLYRDGVQQYLGQLWRAEPTNGMVAITNSHKWVAAQMEDERIHFYAH